MFKYVRNLFFANEGIATKSPKKIEMIIEIDEIKIVVVNPLNKNFRFVRPSMLLGDKINQFNSFLLHELRSKIKSKKNKFLTFKIIKN